MTRNEANKAVKYRIDRLDAAPEASSYRDVAHLAYKSPRTEEEDALFINTGSAMMERKIEVIKRIPDARLYDYGHACLEHIVDQSDPIVVRGCRKDSGYDAKGFPIDGPAYMVWINAERTAKGTAYGEEWLSEQDRIFAELVALA